MGTEANRTSKGSLKDDRLLIVAPTGRDSDLLVKVLGEAGIDAYVCRSVEEACEATAEGCAALLIAEEALSGPALVAIHDLMDRQPEWSDLPVLILVAGGRETMETRARTQERASLHLNNMTLLERPIRIGSLISSVKMALRSRSRQYEVRENLAVRATAEEAVRRSEKLAVAGRLAASIAHEINNPLESVTNLLYLISTTENIDEVRGFADMAQQELARVSEITTQTLRFHRQQSAPTEVALVDILESVLSLFQRRLTGANIDIRRDFRSSGRLSVYAGEIRQVIANLVQNALDAMAHGGTLHLRIVAVGEHRVRGTAGVRLTVADSGSGIPERIRTTLFEPFVTTKGATGTGLGLWVSKEIVAKHRGELTFRSSVHESHHGTVFSIFLPLAKAA